MFVRRVVRGPAPLLAATTLGLLPQTAAAADSSGAAGGALIGVIAAVAAMMILLTVMAVAFSRLKLADARQAIGLPEGSIRALMALLLLVSFAVLAVFFYENISRGGSGEIQALTRAQSAAFTAAHPDYPNLKSAPMAAKDGKPVLSAGDTGEPLYVVTYGGQTSSDDFAKQLITVLETLLTSVFSFYFGAKTATSAVAVGKAAASSPLTAPTTPLATGPATHLMDRAPRP